MVIKPAALELQVPEQLISNCTDWHKSGKWLDAKNYEQVTALLYEAYMAAAQTNDIALASILAAAYQICQACSQAYMNIAAYQQAQEVASQREQELDQQLRTLLNIIGNYKTAALTEKLSTHVGQSEVDLLPQNDLVLEQKIDIWQRAQNFLGKKHTSSLEPKAPLAWIRNLRPTIQPTEKLPVANAPGDQSHGVKPQSPVPDAIQIREKASVPTSYHLNVNPTLAVYCLGAFRIYEDDHPLEEWPGRKGKSILKYLLLNRHKPVTKEILMDLFWPDSDPDAARNNLNVSIYGLRQGLRNGYPDFSHILFQNDCYMLNPELNIWLDVEEFMKHFDLAREFEQKGQVTAMVAEYQAAEALYQGELFEEDRYEDWLMNQRQNLQDAYLSLLDKLSIYYYDHQEYTVCVTLCRKMLVVEPSLENIHRRLMRAYAQQKQYFLALRQYHRCVEMLKEELDVAPDPRTMKLCNSIRNRESF